MAKDLARLALLALGLVLAPAPVAFIAACADGAAGDDDDDDDDDDGGEGEGEGEGDGGGNVIGELCAAHQACVATGSTPRLGDSVVACTTTVNGQITNVQQECASAVDELNGLIGCFRTEIVADCAVLEAPDGPPACADENTAFQNAATPSPDCFPEPPPPEPEPVDLVGGTDDPDAAVFPFEVDTSVGQSDVDCYAFNLAAQTQTIMQTRGDAGGECPGDTVLDLFLTPELAVPLANNDDDNDPRAFNPGSLCSGIYALLEPGDYVLCVTGFGGGIVNNIEITAAVE